MPHHRTVYGLCSSADGVVRYVGATTRPLTARRDGHIYASRQTDSVVAQWVRETIAQGRAVLIVPLIADASLDAERAEIARRVAAGEPLLNVRDGGPCGDTFRAAVDTPADGEHHRSVADGELCLSFSRLAPDTATDVGLLPGWQLIRDANKPVVPREPLHPYNRTPSQVAALASKRAARVAHREAA